MKLDGLLDHSLAGIEDRSIYRGLVRAAIDPEHVKFSENDLEQIVLPSIRPRLDGSVLAFCKSVITEYVERVHRVFSDEFLGIVDSDKQMKRREDNVGALANAVLLEFRGRWTTRWEALAFHSDTQHSLEYKKSALRLFLLRLIDVLVEFVHAAIVRASGYSADTWFAEPCSNRYAAFIFLRASKTSAAAFRAECKAYYLLGYMVHHRTRRGLLDRSSGIPPEFRQPYTQFLTEAFYSNGAEALEEMPDVAEIIGFTRNIEQFDGLKYARRPNFDFYRYISFVYYEIMKPEVALLFHCDRPVERVKATLFQSRTALDMLSTSCPACGSICPVALQGLYRFIVRGFLNTSLKDTYCRRLKSAMGPSTGSTIRTMLLTLEHKPTASSSERSNKPLFSPTSVAGLDLHSPDARSGDKRPHSGGEMHGGPNDSVVA
ncbi:hypothetical protein B484DRAFT_469381 [Ochromonadaceae sp. CCMP2298]|nr:hypothetical protein B484DRAFT_469381 [Ochromonadaceae sp. CCMP2298]